MEVDHLDTSISGLVSLIATIGFLYIVLSSIFKDKKNDKSNK